MVSLVPAEVPSNTGTEVTLGFAYAPLKVGVFVEYSMHSGKRKADKLTGDGTETASGVTLPFVFDNTSLSDFEKKEKSEGARSIRLGVSVGI